MLPIRVRQAPQLMRALVHRRKVLRREARPQRCFRLCFFSCHSYFAYLYCSLHSLVRHVTVPVRVYIFNDAQMPLSDAQIDALRALVPTLEVHLWPKSMGWGAEQIASIWRAYELAARGAADDDIVARVDSDVFFFNDRVFQLVQRSDADVVGDGHFVDFAYSQGGCYFLRAAAVRRIVEWLGQRDIAAEVARAAVPVEDVAMHHFARSVGLDVCLTWFMMFPDELRNAGGLTAWQRHKFSCLHFVMKNKAAMLQAYRAHVLQPEEVAAFDQSIQVA